MYVNEDLNYAFALSGQCMRILGIWPDSHASSSNVRRLNLRIMLIICSLCFYVVMPQIMNMIRIWGNVAQIVQYIAAVNFAISVLCKLIVTQYYKQTIRTLITLIMDDWMTWKSDWERNTMRKMAKLGRSLSFKCYLITTIGFIFYMFVYLLKFYQTWHQLSLRRLIYHYPYFFNIQKSPNYEITYFIQIFCAVLITYINSTIDSFISMLLLHVCAQLINLRKSLNDLVDELANNSISSLRFKESLAAIIIRHERLIRNAKTIDDCYSAALFMYMLAATFQLCFQTFQIYVMITDKDSSISIFKLGFLTVYGGIVLVHLYCYCYTAERLFTESTSMAQGVYECRWYDLPPKDAKDLMFIVYRSRIPLRLTAGKFGTFSIEMFGTMVKTSMGYLSALLTMRD